MLGIKKSSLNKNQLIVLLVFFLTQSLHSQIVQSFSPRFQANQKGGITVISNVSVSCGSASGCSSAQGQTVITGGNSNGAYTQSYVDIDGNSSTFMSSSDSLNLTNCSEILFAGLYWSGRITSTTANYSTRNSIKLKVNSGTYQPLTADNLLDVPTIGGASWSHPSYFCFKNITSIVSANGIKGRYTIADLVTQSGSSNLWGGWSIVIVYKNVFKSMRNLTVYDGFANISAGNSLDIPISGFVTPLSGPVSFELGVIAMDGDRDSQGDQFQFNGAGSFVNVSDALHGTNNFFNSMIAENGVITPYRNPNYSNSLGYDAGIFSPINSSYQYINNGATNATVRVTTSSENILTRVITSAIDVYEPDLRASVRIKDLNGGLVSPGDILEYTMVGKNIGSDISIGSFMTDTLDPRVTYLPNSTQVTFGPNSGVKTDVSGDDQGEYIAASKVVKVRIGTGANATTGGQVTNSFTGVDSTVIKFKVTVNNDCLVFLCDNTLDNVAYIFGEGNISGNTYDNDGVSDLLDANGCPLVASNELLINITSCPPPNIGSNGPICMGATLNLTSSLSLSGVYNWTGPNGFTSNVQNPSITNATTLASGTYFLSITYNGLACSIDTSINVVVNPNPVVANALVTNVSCFGLNNGSIALTMSLAGTYTYSWSNGASTASISNLAPGTYSVTITNSSGCTLVSSYTITQPLIVGASATATSNYSGFNISCFGLSNGSATVTPSGGTAPYTYLWSTGATTQSITNVPAGTYSVTVKDANNCTSPATVVLTQPTALSLNPVISANVSCFGGANGTINITANGGVTPYTYSWSNGSVQEDLSNLSAGNYAVTITDGNGCSTIGSYTITEPTLALSLTQTQTNVSCFGGTNGAINITTTGGTAPYTYSWSNGSNSEDLSNITAGTYSLTITDSKGCQTTGTFVITEPAQPISQTSVIGNVLCFGGASGAIDISVQGGTPAYSFLWSNGATTEDLSGLTAGVYSVVITDANGCTLNQSYTVTQPALALSNSGSVTTVLCNGGADGSISTITQGGTAPYSYSWSNGATTANLVNLPAGTYTLTVTDANGCQTTSTFQVTQPTQPITLTETHIDVACNSGNNGSIDLSITGGTAPYSFAWSNGSLTEDITSLLAGTYSVNVTDANGCTQTSTISITQPASLAYSGSVTNVLCFGGTTGSIDGTTTGGTPPYSYTWSNGQTSEDISNLIAGNYSITTTDANGCSTLTNFTITQPVLPVQVSATQLNVSCNGGNNGTIDLSVSNGTAPYTYLWNNAATTEDVSGLTLGTYTVDITDANGCSAQLTVSITEPNNPIATTTTQFNIPCFGQSTGSIDLSIIGGTAPFAYTWSNGQTTQDIAGLSAGIYSVSITDTNGCSATTSVTISQPNAPLTLTETHQNALCISTQTGAIDLSVTGGTPGFIYLWNNGVTSQDLTALGAGSYAVTVTDANACTQSLTILITDPSNNLVLTETHQNVACFGGLTGSIDLTISNPNPITSIAWSNGAGSEDISGIAAGNYFVNVADLNGCTSFLAVTITQPTAPLTANATVSNVACFGQTNGGINLTVTGGTAPYVYTWTNGSTTEDIGNLAAANYSVLITDANGCTTNFSATITEPASPITASSIQTAVSCFGGNNGSIDLSVFGGVAPYTYSWNNGATTQDLSSITAGNYSVVIQDASGCNLPLSITVSQPALPLTNTALTSNVNCAGNNTGTINLFVNGGTAPYSFSWNNGSASEDLINVAAGVYSVIITDANGCTTSGNYQITQPSTQLTASIAVTNVICHNGATGTATVTATGGTAPYIYAWSNGQNTSFIDSLLAGNISLSVTDAGGCTANLNAFISQPAPVVATTTNTNNLCYGQTAGNISVVANGGVAPYSYLWNTGSTLTFINNLPAAPYFVQITDGNGCTTTFSDTVYQPANSITIASTVVDNICFGQANGAIDITISGGSAPYQHLWNTGLVTEDLTNLLAGQYTVTVVDNNGCLLMQTIAVNQPLGPITIIGNSTAASCATTSTGAIDLTASGPNGPFTYLWSNGSTTEDQINLAAGNYSLTVTNANGCTATASFVITEPLPLIASATLVQVSCFNASNGAINQIISGGTGPYVYLWTNGQTTEDLSNIPSGFYSVTITDANGCSILASYTINQPTNYSVSLSPQNVLCFGGNSGQVFSSVTGGTAPYTYLWNSGANTPSLSGLTAGNYTLTVFDNNGCSTSANTSLSQPAFATSLTAVVANESCANTPTGAINLTVNSPTPGFTYFWNNGAATQDITAITANLYAVTVTDNNGCTTTASFQVAAASAITTSAIITPVDCFENATGAINLSVVGGAPSYSFNWSNGATTEDITNLTAGLYFVTITDQNNCSQGASFNVTQPNDSLQLAGLMIPVSCAGGSNGGIDLVVSGGTTNYSYAWSNNTFGQDLVNVAAGNYSITVTDFNGCNKTEVFNVAQPVVLSLVADVVNVTCFGGNNGSIDITPTGGIENYTISWSNGINAEDISNLTANNYQVNIIDNNGCTFDSIITITQPLTATSLSLVATNVSCYGGNNGAIDLTIIGGTQPYTINWSNGQITEDIQNLIGGIYTVTVVDSNGCTTTGTININTPLAPITFSATTQNVTCFNGTNGQINLSVSGGTAPYTYLWSNNATTQDLINVVAGSYSVTITDDAGCTSVGSYVLTQPASAITITNNITPVSCYGGNNGAINLTINGGVQPYTILWSNTSITEDLTNLTAGTYTVTITDASGCSLNPSYTVAQPFAPLSLTANLNTVSCFGGNNGAIDITTIGGTPAYTYSWSNNSSNEDIQTLSEGSYSLTVTDANGCQLDTALAITQPIILSASSTNSNVPCFGDATGAINLNVIGGVFPYDFAWNNGSIAEDLSSITAGPYSVVITDANGCVLNFATNISQPAQALTATETHQNILCYGANNGSINLTVTGATPAYSYSWSNGANTQDIATLIAGTYTATITDANNCVLLFPVTITQPSAPLTLQNTITNVQCTGESSGAIDITVVGGTSPFTYFWNTGATTQDLVGVPIGQYTLAVTDANNCVTSNIFVITQPASALSATFISSNATCFGLANGSILVTPAGGTVPYTITWPDGSNGNSQSNLVAGNYPIQVTDANGCQVNLQVIITQPEEIITDFTYDISSGCAPLTVTFNNTSQGNTTNCLWSFGNGVTDPNCGSATYTFQNEGCFNITLTNTAANGCFGSLTIDSAICVNSGPQADFSTTLASDIYYSGNVTFNNLSFGATDYTWIFGDGTPYNTEISPTHSYPVQFASTYEVILIAADSNGCIDTAVNIIQINEDFSVYIPNTITIDGNDVNESFLPVFTDYSQIKKYRLVIYDRWGELIWQTNDYNEPWDGRAFGKNCQDGIYTWKLIYEDVKLGNRIMVGHVTLLR